MEGSFASILVVCNLEEAVELVGILEGEPIAGAVAKVATSDGGDDTITRFVADQPEVVVMTATLDAGDARSLVSALRGAATAGTFHVVLVGDTRGPIRNALDAADFAIDRFVARPVAAKALRYAVTTGVTAARKTRAGGNGTDTTAAPVAVVPERASTRRTGTHRAVMITPPTGFAAVQPPVEVAPDPLAARLDAMIDAAVADESRAEVVRRTSGGFAIPVDAILAAGGILDAGEAVTAPITVHDVPTRPVSELERRVDAALAAAAAEDVPQPRRTTLPGYALEEQPPQPTRARTVPPPPPPPRRRAQRISEAPVSVNDEDIVELDSAVFELDIDDPPALVAESTAMAVGGEESGSHVLPLGLEAPVVSSIAGSFDDDAPATGAGWPASTVDEEPPRDEWDPPSMPPREPTMILSGSSAPVPLPAGIDVTERRPDERWAPTESLPAIHDEPAAVDEAKAPPSGGEFARELRKKMSMMAQRLFRGTDVPTPPSVDVRPPHDFRTEIDLAEIEAADAGAAAVYDLSGDATFAGDDHGLPTNPGLAHEGGPPTSGTASARTSESGEITRGTSDAAVLIARMFTGEYTGKVTFRRTGAEKTIFFDAGRPVFASSDLSEDRMGELLYREGKITAEQFAGCRDIVLESGRRMGEILVDRGYLKRRELLPAVRRHVEDIIYSLFAWDAGEYRIVPGDGASGERIRLSRHPAAMVLEGVRRKLGLGTLERLLGPTTTVVEVADRDKAGTVVAVADLQPDERAALAAMDGSADLGHIARATGAVLVTVYHLAWAMVLLGVGTVRRRGHEDDDAPALVGETDLAIDRERVRARHRLVAEADYFALLGVRRDATGFEIRRAYESSRRDFDAESFPPELRAELGLELAEVSSVLDEAYRVLRDDRLRAAYLSHLAE